MKRKKLLDRTVFISQGMFMKRLLYISMLLFGIQAVSILGMELGSDSSTTVVIPQAVQQEEPSMMELVDTVLNGDESVFNKAGAWLGSIFGSVVHQQKEKLKKTEEYKKTATFAKKVGKTASTGKDGHINVDLTELGQLFGMNVHAGKIKNKSKKTLISKKPDETTVMRIEGPDETTDEPSEAPLIKIEEIPDEEVVVDGGNEEEVIDDEASQEETTTPIPDIEPIRVQRSLFFIKFTGLAVVVCIGALVAKKMHTKWKKAKELEKKKEKRNSRNQHHVNKATESPEHAS